MAQFVDPLRAGRAFRGLGWFLRDFRAYRRMPEAERMAMLDVMPVLTERDVVHELDAHYFYLGAWASRRILATAPKFHVDIGAQTVMATTLSAAVPLVYLDHRILIAHVPGLRTLAGDLTGLPFATGSISSLSCLHVAEHVGLGRYGDPLDPAGTRKAARELARVLAPGGNLFFAVPVGRERVAFNAHRIHAPETIREYFGGLQLREFSGVDDLGRFHTGVPLERLRGEEYGCGFFWFTR